MINWTSNSTFINTKTNFLQHFVYTKEIIKHGQRMMKHWSKYTSLHYFNAIKTTFLNITPYASNMSGFYLKVCGDFSFIFSCCKNAISWRLRETIQRSLAITKALATNSHIAFGHVLYEIITLPPKDIFIFVILFKLV